MNNTSKMNTLRKNHEWFLLLFHSMMVCLLFSMVAQASNCREFPPTSTNWETLMKIEGEYSNCTYGYSVRIPEGLVGRSSPPPSPQHGFGILLSTQPKGYVWIDGSYNSLEWESPEQAANQHIEWIEADAKILSLQKVHTTLQGVSALRCIVQYECSEEMMVNEYILALDKRQIVYTLGLLAAKTTYPEYHTLLESILATWQFTEIPCEQE